MLFFSYFTHTYSLLNSYEWEINFIRFRSRRTINGECLCFVHYRVNNYRVHDHCNGTRPKPKRSTFFFAGVFCRSTCTYVRTLLLVQIRTRIEMCVQSVMSKTDTFVREYGRVVLYVGNRRVWNSSTRMFLLFRTNSFAREFRTTHDVL